MGLTTVGRSQKERNLKRNPAWTATIHQGPSWITVEGKARVRSWDDTDPETMRRLLREIRRCGPGGTHDDWEAYDRAMREERRAAVVIVPSASTPDDHASAAPGAAHGWNTVPVWRGEMIVVMDHTILQTGYGCC